MSRYSDARYLFREQCYHQQFIKEKIEEKIKERVRRIKHHKEFLPHEYQERFFLIKVWRFEGST
jgi:hypothetical protein